MTGRLCFHFVQIKYSLYVIMPFTYWSCQHNVLAPDVVGSSHVSR